MSVVTAMKTQSGSTLRRTCRISLSRECGLIELTHPPRNVLRRVFLFFACRSPGGFGSTRFAQSPRSEVRFFTDVLRANGYCAGLDGRIREAKHINRPLREAGMQSLDERFGHFVRSVVTINDSLFQVADRVSAALDKVSDKNIFPFTLVLINRTERPH